MGEAKPNRTMDVEQIAQTKALKWQHLEKMDYSLLPVTAQWLFPASCEFGSSATNLHLTFSSDERFSAPFIPQYVLTATTWIVEKWFTVRLTFGCNILGWAVFHLAKYSCQRISTVTMTVQKACGTWTVYNVHIDGLTWWQCQIK